MAKKLTKKDLVSAYKELDKVVGIDPAIEYDELTLEEFEIELYNSLELIEEGDKFTKATQAVFDALTEKYGNADEDQDDEEDDEEDEIPELDEDDEKEEEEDDEEDEEEEPEPEPVKKGKAKGKEKPKPEPKSKAKSKVKPEPEPEEEDEDEDEDEDEPAPKKKGKVKEEKPKKEPKPKREKLEVTRADNFAEIWNEGVAYTRNEWVDKMIELYPKKTGKVPAQVHFAAYSSILLKLGFMKKTKDNKFVKAK